MGAFVREVVTPRFPDGLTVVNAVGQGARSPPATGVEAETARRLIIVLENTNDAQTKRAEIKTEYRSRFGQKGVFHVDFPGWLVDDPPAGYSVARVARRRIGRVRRSGTASQRTSRGSIPSSARSNRGKRARSRRTWIRTVALVAISSAVPSPISRIPVGSGVGSVMAPRINVTIPEGLSTSHASMSVALHQSAEATGNAQIMPAA